MGTTNLRATLRYLRIVHATFLFTVLLYFYALTVLRPQEHRVPPAIVICFMAVSTGTITLALFFRSRKVTPAVEILRRNAEDAVALTNWRSGNILSFTLAETIVLFGFVLKYLGAGWNLAGIFFGVGVFLFFVWTPRLDVPTSS